jgi:hypothetical protein
MTGPSPFFLTHTMACTSLPPNSHNTPLAKALWYWINERAKSIQVLDRKLAKRTRYNDTTLLALEMWKISGPDHALIPDHVVEWIQDKISTEQLDVIVISDDDDEETQSYEWTFKWHEADKQQSLCVPPLVDIIGATIDDDEDDMPLSERYPETNMGCVDDNPDFDMDGISHE